MHGFKKLAALVFKVWLFSVSAVDDGSIHQILFIVLNVWSVFSPVLNTKQFVVDSTIQIRIDYLHVLPTNLRTASRLNTSATSTINLPWPVNLVMNRLRVDPSSTLSASVRARDICITLQDSDDSSLIMSLTRELMIRIDKYDPSIDIQNEYLISNCKCVSDSMERKQSWVVGILFWNVERLNT